MAMSRTTSPDSLAHLKETFVIRNVAISWYIAINHGLALIALPLHRMTDKLIDFMETF